MSSVVRCMHIGLRMSHVSEPNALWPSCGRIAFVFLSLESLESQYFAFEGIKTDIKLVGVSLEPYLFI